MRARDSARICSRRRRRTASTSAWRIASDAEDPSDINSARAFSERSSVRKLRTVTRRTIRQRVRYYNYAASTGGTVVEPSPASQSAIRRATRTVIVLYCRLCGPGIPGLKRCFNCWKEHLAEGRDDRRRERSRRSCKRGSIAGSPDHDRTMRRLRRGRASHAHLLLPHCDHTPSGTNRRSSPGWRSGYADSVAAMVRALHHDAPASSPTAGYGRPMRSPTTGSRIVGRAGGPRPVRVPANSLPTISGPSAQSSYRRAR